ncbi:MAG TPA: hypothetical protein ENI93_02645 [Gammaproteobacteria bacterium]|nr:hypothetical protein [Gammaproteobacteria bacterium]
MKTSVSVLFPGAVLAVFLLLTGCGGSNGSPTGDTMALQIIASSIRDGQTRVATDTTISVTFSAPIDPATVNIGSFMLEDSSGPLAGTVSLDADGVTATFMPDAPLPARDTLVATLTTAIRSLTGQVLPADHVIRFSTAPWTRQAGTPDDDVSLAITTDPAGNLYVAGHTTGTLAGQTRAGGQDIIVIKYDAAGRELWARQFGTPASDQAAAIALGASGRLQVAGTTGGAFPGQTSSGGTDAIILTLDTDGQLIDTIQFGTAGDDVASALVIDSNGNRIVAGQTTGAFTGFVSAGGTDVFVRAFSPQGTVLWTDQFGSNGQDSGAALVADSNGNVYLAGTAGGSLDGNTALSFNDIFLTAHDTASGTRLWLRQLRTLPPDTTPALTNETARALAIDASGNLYIAGDRLDVLSGTNGLDMLLVKCDNTGNPVSADTFGTSNDDRLNAIAIDNQGNLYAAGQSVGNLAGTGAGLDDIIVLKRDANGNRLWARQTGTSAADLANALTLSANGDLVITGQTGDGLDGNTPLGGSDLFLMRFAPDGTPD